MTVVEPELPVLSDGVIHLRPFRADDAVALAEIWADPVIRARNTVPEPTELAAASWIADRAADVLRGAAWEWAVVDESTRRLAGRRALKHIDWKNGHASAGGWMSPSFRGRQFAPRSLRLAATHAFARGLVRVEAKVEADNEASLRSVRSAGMRHEGTLRLGFRSNVGHHVDAEVYSLLAEDLATAPTLRAGL